MLILALDVAVAPRLISAVNEKGDKAPEFICQKLEEPIQFPVERQTFPVESGRVYVLAAVKSAEVSVPV